MARERKIKRSRRSDSGARAKNKASERAGERAGKKRAPLSERLEQAMGQGAYLAHTRRLVVATCHCHKYPPLLTNQ